MDIQSNYESSTTTRRVQSEEVLNENDQPGEMLKLEFIEPMVLSQNKVARGVGVSQRRINNIVLGKHPLFEGGAYI